MKIKVKKIKVNFSHTGKAWYTLPYEWSITVDGRFTDGGATATMRGAEREAARAINIVTKNSGNRKKTVKEYEKEV